MVARKRVSRLKTPPDGDAHAAEEHRSLVDEAERARRRERAKLNEHLSSLRLEHHYSQAEMAELMGVSLRSYQGYESAERDIPSGAIIELYSNLNIDLHTLYVGEPVPQSPEQRIQSVNFAFRVSDHIRVAYPKLEEAEVRQLAKEYAKYARFDDQVDGGVVDLCFNALFKPNFNG